MRTIKELAQEALNVQDAINFFAIVKGMDRALANLKEHGFNGHTLAKHPIAVLWVDKLASLQGVQDLGNEQVSKAYDAVYVIVGDRGSK
jgi:hypothetical protein